MHVLIFNIWISVIFNCIRLLFLSQSNYTSWDWNLTEMHVLFIDIWVTVSDYNTNPTVIILVGIGILTYEMHVLFIDIWMTVSDYNTNSTVIILVGILTKYMFYSLISG